MFKLLFIGIDVLAGSSRKASKKRNIGPDGNWHGPKGRVSIALPWRYRVEMLALGFVGAMAVIARAFMLAFFGISWCVLFVMLWKWFGTPWLGLAAAAGIFLTLWLVLMLRACNFRQKRPLFGSRKRRGAWLLAVPAVVAVTALLAEFGGEMLAVMIGIPLVAGLIISAFAWYADGTKDHLAFRDSPQVRRAYAVATLGTEPLRDWIETIAYRKAQSVTRKGETAQLKRLFNLSDRHLAKLHATLRKAKFEEGAPVLPAMAERALRTERRNSWRRVIKCAK